MIQKKIQYPFLQIIISAAIIFNLSCNYFIEPDPYINTVAHPMIIDTTMAVLSNYTNDEEVMGDIVPTFLPDISSSDIDSIKVYVDSAFVGSMYKSPYTININTRLWTNGRHMIYYHVFKNKAGDSLGVLALVQDYERVYKIGLIFQGKSLLLGKDIKGGLDNLEDRVIFLHDPYSPSDATIFSVSTETCSTLNSKKLLFNDLVSASRSLDQKRLFLLMGWGTIYVLNSDNFAQEDLYGLATSRNDFSGFAVGADDRLYCSAGNSLYIFHNGLANSYTFFNGPIRFLSVSQNGSTMLAVDNNGIKNFSLQDDRAIFSFQSGIRDSIRLFRADWGNSRLFVTRQSTIVEVWDIQNLNPVGTFQLSTSGTAINVTALTANSEFLYVAYTHLQNNRTSSIVAEYNIATQKQTRTWTFPLILQYLMGSENGRYMFACTSTDQWIVDIGGTP